MSITYTVTIPTYVKHIYLFLDHDHSTGSDATSNLYFICLRTPTSLMFMVSTALAAASSKIEFQ